MNIAKVEEISRVSKLEKWPYPRTFNSLKDAGVESYKTNVSNHELTYNGDGKSWVEKAPNAPTIDISKTFDATAVAMVIQKHTTEKTSYETFLKGIATAGVVCYVVDMNKNEISYQGANPGESYVEKIPQF